jgi:hypothetical protein
LAAAPVIASGLFIASQLGRESIRDPCDRSRCSLLQIEQAGNRPPDLRHGQRWRPFFKRFRSQTRKDKASNDSVM